VPAVHGYLTWCECGWNLTAADQALPAGRLERLYAAAGRRVGDRLAAELLSVERLEPRLTPSRLAAYAIAALVFFLAAALVAGAVVLAVVAFPNAAAIFVALLMLAIAWVIRPRLGKPPERNVLSRTEAPTLYALVDEVATALEVPSVDVLVVDHEYNASWAVVGLRRTRVLTLGLPLLTVLSPRQRIALVAHELAHARNGDSSRGLVVGSALRALSELFWVLRPDGGGLSRGGYITGAFEPVVNAVFWLLSRPVRALLMLELHLLLHDSRRAEYLADALAARVAGTEASVELQEKLLLAPMFGAVVQLVAHPGAGEVDLFEELARAFGVVPERERERRRRVARLEETRLGATHPPTAHRIRLLEGRPRAEPLVDADADRAQAVDSELARRRRALQATLVDERRASLYA
jgi:Zn-dependent protease with chaperone function